MAKRKWVPTVGGVSKRARRFMKRRSTAKRSWRKKYLRGKSGFAKAVKAVVLSTAEKKFKIADVQANSAYDAAFQGFALNHNSTVELSLVNNTSPTANHITFITQGSTDSNRNGDEIYAKGIMLRGSIVLPADRKNARFRIFLVEYNSVQGSPVNYAEFYHSVTGKNVLDPIQADRWKAKVLGDYTYKAHDTDSSLTEGQRADILIKKWIPWRRKLCYNDDTSTVVSKGMKERLSIVVQSWDNNSAFSTSTVGYILMTATLHYGDP